MPAYHGGAELGASRTVGSITDVGQIGRTEQAGGDSGLQSETGCAGGRPADIQAHTAGPVMSRTRAERGQEEAWGGRNNEGHSCGQLCRGVVASAVSLVVGKGGNRRGLLLKV